MPRERSDANGLQDREAVRNGEQLFEGVELCVWIELFNFGVVG